MYPNKTIIHVRPSTHMRQQDMPYNQQLWGSSTLPHSNMQPTRAVDQTNPIPIQVNCQSMQRAALF